MRIWYHCAHRGIHLPATKILLPPPPNTKQQTTWGAIVGTQDGGYLRKVPLPRIPLLQSTALTSCAAPLGNQHTCYLQVSRIPTWSDLTRSHLGALRSSILPLALRWLM
jgi:hypothetical protein